MKRLLIILLVAFVACNSSNNNNAPKHLPTSLVNNPMTADGMDTVAAARKATMDFIDTFHNFGTIHEKEVVEHDFVFTNNGKSPLIINSAVGSCGCTVADYPHTPIPPGKTDTMKVAFNSAGKHGHQVKSVTIHTNTLGCIHMLYINADIADDK